MNLRIFVLLMLLPSSLSVRAEELRYSYSVDDETTSTVTQTSFLQHFYGVIVEFQTELSEFRIPVIPLPEWENPYFTAYTAEANGVMRLGFWGGMARIPGMNDDAVALITCHEVGHLAGGAPYIHIDLSTYEGVSSEGQADYYATKTCLKRYFAKLPDTLGYLERELDPQFRAVCEERSVTSFEEAMCLRMMNGIEGFRHAVKILKPDLGEIDYLSHDSDDVEETIFNTYPSNQCRIDTFIAGFFDDERPACWFESEY